jgi:hypothetical protein
VIELLNDKLEQILNRLEHHLKVIDDVAGIQSQLNYDFIQTDTAHTLIDCLNARAQVQYDISETHIQEANNALFEIAGIKIEYNNDILAKKIEKIDEFGAFILAVFYDTNKDAVLRTVKQTSHNAHIHQMNGLGIIDGTTYSQKGNVPLKTVAEICDLTQTQREEYAKKLAEWGFIRTSNKSSSAKGINSADGDLSTSKNSNEDKLSSIGFVSAKSFAKSESKKLLPTLLGKRISELYLDPYTANYIISYLQEGMVSPIALLFMFANCIEMKPLLSVGVKNSPEIESWLADYEDELGPESELLGIDYIEMLKAVRTTMFFHDWINEFSEEKILEKYGVRPGEIKYKVDVLDWLIYSATEIANLKNKDFVKYLIRLRIRVKNGCKEELIPLLKFKNIGRVRARRLFANGIKTVHDVKASSLETLSAVVGKNIAASMKEDVGESKPKEMQLKFA